MKSFLERLQDESKTQKPVVMAFGRMNPPTIGHQKLVNKVHQLAKDYGADHRVIVSHSVDSKKNPLDAKTKLKHAKRFFPNTNIDVSDKEHPTFLHHAAKLYAQGHDHLIMVAGSDRVKEYEQKLKQYNGTAAGSLFNFKRIDVKSAGERDPDAEGAEGMSASKMRDHAKNKDFNSFRQGVPNHVTDNHAKELMQDVRRGLGLHENVNRGMFKAIFVTGGPGSGKDVILREAIAESRMVELNSNQAFDLLMDKQKLSEKATDPRRHSIKSRHPLIINGPADDDYKMLRIKEELEELGYDTMMVFVDTTNEASQVRNEKLTKMISESIRQDKWKTSQKNKNLFFKEFDQFIYFNNSASLGEIEEDITDIYQKIKDFIEVKILNEEAYVWLKNHNKLNNNITDNSIVEEQNYVTKDSRFIQRLKESREGRGKTSPRLYRTDSGNAPSPSDIPADNRASDPATDDIKWNGTKKSRGSYIFRTYTEAKETSQASLTKNPEPKKANFRKDKEKSKVKNRFTDSATVNQRVRNVAGVGPEFDTRQQGTVYPMSGLGDVTYREEKSFNRFRKAIQEYKGFQNDIESGFGGVLGGSDNKETIENPHDKMGYSYDIVKRKKDKKK